MSKWSRLAEIIWSEGVRLEWIGARTVSNCLHHLAVLSCSVSLVPRPHHILVIGPRNSTWFTRPISSWEVWSGHKTIAQCGHGITYPHVSWHLCSEWIWRHGSSTKRPCPYLQCKPSLNPRPGVGYGNEASKELLELLYMNGYSCSGSTGFVNGLDVNIPHSDLPSAHYVNLSPSLCQPQSITTSTSVHHYVNLSISLHQPQSITMSTSVHHYINLSPSLCRDGQYIDIIIYHDIESPWQSYRGGFTIIVISSSQY